MSEDRPDQGRPGARPRGEPQVGGFPERLETERLVLRRWLETDREAVLGIWADPDVWRAIGPGAVGMPFEAEYPSSRFRHHLSHWERYGFGLWLAEQRGTGEVAGWVGAAHPSYLPDLAGAVEIAWTLRRPFWGRALASEGAAAATKAAFAHLGLDGVVSLIGPANARSIAVAERLGMSPDREVRRPDTGERMLVYRRGR
jgi:RimJ/RimL family protein N-acetyltransferase